MNARGEMEIQIQIQIQILVFIISVHLEAMDWLHAQELVKRGGDYIVLILIS